MVGRDMLVHAHKLIVAEKYRKSYLNSSSPLIIVGNAYKIQLINDTDVDKYSMTVG
tara:strand:- start:677 stop:844 length:168 start_codon:yes stop_codon:yes gene_type:complete